MKLSRRLLYSYGLIFCVILAVLVVAQYFTTSNFLRERIFTSNSETMDQTIVTLNQYFNDVETYMFNLSINKQLQGYLADTDEKNGYLGAVEANAIVTDILSADVFAKKTAGVFVYADRQDAYPIYNTSNISMTSGQSESRAVFRALDVKEQDWYLDAIELHGQTTWREPEWDFVRKKKEFSVTRAIVNTKKLRETLGVIRVFVSTSYIQNILNEVTLGNEGKVYLYCGGSLMNYADYQSLPDVLEMVGDGDGSAQRISIDGQTNYIISRSVGVSDWKLVGIVPDSSIDYQLILLRTIMVVVLLMGVLLTLAISYGIAKSVSRPISLVARTMQNYELNQRTRFEEQRKDEVGILFSSYNRMADEISRLLNEVRLGAERQRKAELHALQAQINPHFLYNTLDCISSLAYIKNTPEISELTLALSEFFRISLNKGKEELPLRRELEHVANYCAIQRYRAGYPIILKIDVPEELKECNVIKLILQPLVENSILHGFSGCEGERIIRIGARRDGEYLLLSVKDNGRGADVEYLNGILTGEYRYVATQAGGSGYGITNVNERIQLAFGGESGLYFMENEDGCGLCAVLRILLKEGVDNGDGAAGGSENEGAAG